jgi:hypothetical protein
VQYFSIVCFILSSAGLHRFVRIFVLSKESFYFLTPFLFNMFVENEVFLYAVNSVLSPLLLHCLGSHWKWRAISFFGAAVGLISGALTWLILSLISLVFPRCPAETCGSYPTVLGFAVALVYAARSEAQPLGSFAATPLQLFRATLLWTGVYLRWAPTAALSGLIGIVVAVLVLSRCADRIGFPRNERFCWRSLVRETQEDDQEALIDAFAITDAPDFSEAEQNRRMRALRAIEDRLASMESDK